MSRFLVDRNIFEKDLWQDPVTFRLFFYLVAKASFKDGAKIGGVELKRGQYLRSYRKIQEDLSYVENRAVKTPSLSTIKRSVGKLVKENRIKIEEAELGTLFTLVNYDAYQEFPDRPNSELETQSEQRWNSVGTTAEQLPNNKNKDINKNINKGGVEKRASATPPLLSKFQPILILRNKITGVTIGEEDWIRRGASEKIKASRSGRVNHMGNSFSEFCELNPDVKKMAYCWLSHPPEHRMAAAAFSISKADAVNEFDWALRAIENEWESYKKYLPGSQEAISKQDYEVNV